MGVIIRRFSLVDGEHTVETCDTCREADGFDVQEGTLFVLKAPEAKTKGEAVVLRAYAQGQWICAGYDE